MAAQLVMLLEAKQFVSSAYNAGKAIHDSLIAPMVEATNKIQRMENTLVTSTGSIEGARTEMAYLRTVTDKLGTSLVASVEPYAKLAASVNDMSQSDLHTVFEGFSTALAATHASAEKVQGTFLALQQIASKGKLNMQDLRRQLAEHIPGAMKIAADAMEMTMEQFVEAVRKGTIETNEWLVKAATGFEEKFKEGAERAAKSVKAELERMSTALAVFQSEVFQSGGAEESYINTLSKITEEVYNNQVVIERLAKAYGHFGKVAEEATIGMDSLAEGGALLAEGTGWWAEKMATATTVMGTGLTGTIAGVSGAIGLLIQNEDLVTYATDKMNLAAYNQEQALRRLSGEAQEVATTQKLIADAVAESEAAMKKAADAAMALAEKEAIAFGILNDNAEKLSAIGLKRQLDNRKEHADIVKKGYEDQGLFAEEYYQVLKQKMEADTAEFIKHGADKKKATEKLAADLKTLHEDMFGKTAITNTLRSLTELKTGLDQYGERIISISGTTVTWLEKTNDGWRTVKEEVKYTDEELAKIKQRTEDAATSAERLAQNFSNAKNEAAAAATATAKLAAETRAAAEAKVSKLNEDYEGGSGTQYKVNERGEVVTTGKKRITSSSISMSGSEQAYYKGIVGSGTTTNPGMRMNAGLGAISDIMNARQGSGLGEGVTMNNYFNQSLSRSDVTNITEEQTRSAERA